MGNEGQFPIKISGDASSLLAASQQSNAALESTKIKLAELTPQQKALTQEIEANSKASNEAGRAHNDHSEKLKFLGLRTGELKKLTRELSQEFPVAGMAARLMINPIVAGLTIAIMIFGGAKKALDDWNKALDASAERNAGKDFLPGIEAKKAALDGASASAAAFAGALGSIGAAEDKFKTSVSQAIDKLHEFMNAQAEVSTAAEAKELAEVDLKQKQGKLTEMGAIKARGEIRERYRKQQEDLKTKGEQEELGLQETELAHDKQSRTGLAEAAADAAKKRDTLKGLRGQLAADLEEGNKKTNAEGTGVYDKELAEASKALDAAQQRSLLKTIGTYGDEGVKQVGEAQADVDTAQRFILLQQRLNRQAQAAIKRLDEGRLPPAEEAAKAAGTRLMNNEQRINELEQTLPARRGVIDIRERGRAEAGALKGQTAGIETQAQLDEIKKRLLKEYDDAKARGTGLSPDWYRQMGEFATPAAGQAAGGTNNETASLHAQLAAAQKQIAAERQAFIDNISASRVMDQATVQKLEADTVKMAAHAKTIADLEKRVRDIEGRPPRT